MIIGIVSDTHKDKMNALPHIIEEFRKRKVKAIIHCGDIEERHLDAELFDNLPVICALVEEQVSLPGFNQAPNKWIFTKPGDRVRYLPDQTKVYVGHKRSFEFLKGPESDLLRTMDEIRRDHDCLRLMTSGHTHHQIFAQTRIVNFINPGAVEDSLDGGYEFAVYDTENGNATFSRIPTAQLIEESFSVGIVSDSFNISKLDPLFWKKLKEELKSRNVSHIIHCGNLSLEDIGIKELEEFDVWYSLRKDQHNPREVPINWHLVPLSEPVVKINGYRFCIQLDLGAKLIERSELDLHKICLKLKREYPEITYVLCGFTNDAFLGEGQQVKVINPGDIFKDRNFAVITLPINEIFFGHVPVAPLK